MAKNSDTVETTEADTKPATIPSNFDDETFDVQDPLAGKVIDREYAKTGSLSNDGGANDEAIDRVEEFNFEDFDPELIEATDSEPDAPHLTQDNDTSRDSASTEETSLGKKAQAQLVKSQSKKVVNMYCFVVLWTVRKFCKVNEQTIYIEEEKGTLSSQQIISGLPLIEHIRKANKHIEDLDFDPDQREEMREALEIYMISQNITTSPGANLALAVLVPTIGLFAKGYETKSNMKSLIKSVQALHIEAAEKNQQLLASLTEASQTAQNLSSELEEAKTTSTEQQRLINEQTTELEKLRKLVTKDNEPSRARGSARTTKTQPAKTTASLPAAGKTDKQSKSK